MEEPRLPLGTTIDNMKAYHDILNMRLIFSWPSLCAYSHEKLNGIFNNKIDTLSDINNHSIDHTNRYKNIPLLDYDSNIINHGQTFSIPLYMCIIDSKSKLNKLKIVVQNMCTNFKQFTIDNIDNFFDEHAVTKKVLKYFFDNFKTYSDREHYIKVIKKLCIDFTENKNLLDYCYSMNPCDIKELLHVQSIETKENPIGKLIVIFRISTPLLDDISKLSRIKKLALVLIHLFVEEFYLKRLEQLYASLFFDSLRKYTNDKILNNVKINQNNDHFFRIKKPEDLNDTAHHYYDELDDDCVDDKEDANVNIKISSETFLFKSCHIIDALYNKCYFNQTVTVDDKNSKACAPDMCTNFTIDPNENIYFLMGKCMSTTSETLNSYTEDLGRLFVFKRNLLDCPECFLNNYLKNYILAILNIATINNYILHKMQLCTLNSIYYNMGFNLSLVTYPFANLCTDWIIEDQFKWKFKDISKQMKEIKTFIFYHNFSIDVYKWHVYKYEKVILHEIYKSKGNKINGIEIKDNDIKGNIKINKIEYMKELNLFISQNAFYHEKIGYLTSSKRIYMKGIKQMLDLKSDGNGNYIIKLSNIDYVNMTEKINNALKT